MMLQYLLSFLLLVLGVVNVIMTGMVVFNVIGTVRNVQAQREFRSLLRHSKSVGGVRDVAINGGVVNSEELMRIIAALYRASEGLPPQQRRLISKTLYQSDINGRARYAATLMSEAGIGSGSLTLADP